MARITAAEKEANKLRLDKLITNVFLEDGWDAVTYDRIAKEADIRKSTLQGYYPSRADFGEALRGKVLPVFLDYLNFASRETLIESWTDALKFKKFRLILNMMIITATQGQTNEMAVKGLANFIQHVTKQLGETAYEDVELLLGRTIIRLMED
ncbi:TetR family transcriptional regulator [Thaumasiovibrio subtropicus]|uniref:TetR family transcriptional regulator n=1 Tax=Thaumasiovibrio subtropicus TaxID=1891207 RepID=UPI000B3637D5|nr:TetR family transcriptional regulator [Thaumasiovibrio subtropicus]